MCNGLLPAGIYGDLHGTDIAADHGGRQVVSHFIGPFVFDGRGLEHPIDGPHQGHGTARLNQPQGLPRTRPQPFGRGRKAGD